jgi:hydroxymethylpyrimidine pyrophosphatase-like HAD family hydrolase
MVVASDLDGTLLDSAHVVSPRTVAAIAALRRAGGVFVAVTARPLRDAAAIARGCGADLLVCAGGAILFDPQAGRVVSSVGFPPTEAARLVSTLRAAFPDVRLGLDDGERCVLDPGFDMGHPGVADTAGSGPVVVGEGPVLKVILQSPTITTDVLAARARERLGPVTVSCPAFAEVLPRGVDKASHLIRLFPPSTVPTAAFGDTPGDLPMLDWAGTAVAMANAHPAVLARCDRVTASNDEDGVAVVLDQLCACLTRTG